MCQVAYLWKLRTLGSSVHTGGHEGYIEPLTPDGGFLEGGGRPAFSAFVGILITTARRWLNISRDYFAGFTFLAVR
jgi:hypothetical protein